LKINSKLLAEVVTRLEDDLSPEQISRSLKEEYPGEPSMQVSHETIYLSLYVQGRGTLRKELTKHLRRRHQIRQPQKREANSRGKIKDMINISERPAEAADRAVPGHWEGDLLFGTRTNAIGTLVERSTRFVMLFKLPSGVNAESARVGLSEKILTLPENLRRSLAWDQGREMTDHVRFTIDTGLQVYFCDPAKPWQRGSNENTNGLLRQYFPSGKTVAHYTQEHLDIVAAKLNRRPRETLGWKTPAKKLANCLEESSAAGVAPTA
jgi:IS30 family transposase